MEQQVNASAFYHFMSRIYGITLHVLNDASIPADRYSSNPESAEFLLSFSNLKERLFDLCGETKKPQILSSEFGQLWAGIPLLDGDHLTEMIVIGPVFTSSGSTNIMFDYVRSYNVSTTPREKLLEALNQSPICSYLEFTRLIAIVYAFAYGEELDTSALPIIGLTHHDIPTELELYPGAEGEPRKENAKDPTYLLGQHLMECVQEGDLDKLKRLLKTFNYSNIHYLSLPDPIRQQKDMFISLIAQVVNAAIQGGLDPEIVHSLYDRYIQQVEAMRNMIPIITLTREMLYDYTSRVGRLKRTNQYTRLVNDCCNYVYEHVYEDLRVTDIAAFVGHNAHYLSQKFRQETGQSLGDYIRSAKVSEAESLLKYSSLSLADISEQLRFSSQSFFTATFRQVTGITPGQFREKADV